jgi:translation initiation factor 6 (eIF-6)
MFLDSSYHIKRMAATASIGVPSIAASMFAKRNWAVVGDVTNTSKPAFRIVNRLQVYPSLLHINDVPCWPLNH